MTSMDDTIRGLVTAALREDVGAGDWTTLWTVPAERTATASIVAKAPGVLSGLDVASEAFRQVDTALRFDPLRAEGDALEAGDRVAALSGAARSILSGERVALNLLQRLSGVATTTRRYVDRVAGTGARILDTRKTTPGMRALEKRAVRAGGGGNHRFGLYDMVLIKENHIRAAGGITAAVERVREQNRQGLAVEVEATDLAEVREALDAGVDRILLDNMDLATLRAAVELVRSGPTPWPATEASGGVSLDTIREIAEAGVDFVSVGALTHSAPALDLSLLIDRG